MNEIEREQEREAQDPIFAEEQQERFERLESQVRHNIEAQKQAYRAAQKAVREGVKNIDDDDDGVEVVYAP